MPDHPARDHPSAHPAPGRRPGPPRWILRYWWAVLAVGIALLAVGALTQDDLLAKGHPFSLGLLCAVAGIAAGIRNRRDARGAHQSP